MTTPYPPSTPTTGTSSSDPDEIRREIERTQAALSTDVDALTDKVSPSRIAQRRVERVRGTASRLKDKVMGGDSSGTHGGGPGTADRARHLAGSASDSISGTAQSAASTVSDTASQAAASVQDAAHNAPGAVVRQTRGNPLAAGLIAFGAGWLVASLIPASQREQELAEQAKERASELGQPVADVAKDVAAEMREHLQEPAQQAVESVRATATDAGRTVAEEGRSAAQNVQDRAQDAAGTVQESSSH